MQARRQFARCVGLQPLCDPVFVLCPDMPPSCPPFLPSSGSGRRRQINILLKRAGINPSANHRSVSAAIPQKGTNLVMRPANVKNKGRSLALENQTQVAPAATFHKRRDSPESDARVQVGLAIRGCRRLHGDPDFLPSVSRDAFEKPWGGQQLHGARSTGPVTSRNWPTRRARAVSFFKVAPTRALCAGVSPYSAAK